DWRESQTGIRGPLRHPPGRREPDCARAGPGGLDIVSAALPCAGAQNGSIRRGVSVLSEFAQAEHAVLDGWAKRDGLLRSVCKPAGAPHWICWSEPPAAAGLPGIHDIPGQASRDMYQRFKTMQGWHVPRVGGLDCHGLPVEVAVEKELGLTGTSDIEAYGQRRFSARCRESVQRHAGAFAALSLRLGCWQDPDLLRQTMDATCIES